MAFGGHPSLFAKSFFPTVQRQASINGGNGNNGCVGLPPVSIPSVSLQEQDTASFKPWFHNSHEDPYGLISCAQSGITSRKPTDNSNWDEETDLLGLVSNILKEADSRDSSHNEGNPPTCNPAWSPKTPKEEFLQYLQSEAQTQYNSTFPPNYVPCEAFSKAQEESVDKHVELSQQSSGITTNQQWLINLPNGDRENFNIYPERLPPGLPIPKLGNTHLSQMQFSSHNMSADTNRANSQPIYAFPEISGVLRPQNTMNSSRFDLYNEDHYTQSSAKPIISGQDVSQDFNQLVSTFQSFMAGEHDGLCRGDFPNTHRSTVYHEDSMAEQWKITSPAMSTQSSPTEHTQQLMGEFGTMQKETNGGVRKPIFHIDGFQDLPGIHSQSTGHFQQQKPVAASFNFPAQYQSKMNSHRENISLPINLSHYSNHNTQRGQIQNKIRSQMQKEKKRIHMSGFAGEHRSARPVTATHRERDKKQALSQNPYFDPLGSMPRFDRGNSTFGSGNTQQIIPAMYPANDPRGYPRLPFNPANVSSRHALPGGSGTPGMDPGYMMSANESAALYGFLSDMMPPTGGRTYHGTSSAITTSALMNPVRPLMQLHFLMDECNKQWSCLERERKKTEVILTKTCLWKQTASVTNANLPKMTPNPTKVDQLIVKQMREHAWVASLLDKMECQRNIPLHINIHMALNRHRMAICVMQASCKEDLANMPKRQQQRDHFTEDRDIPLLVTGLRDLADATRKLRTAMWCALQITVPKPAKKQDHFLNREVTLTESWQSPYCFKL